MDDADLELLRRFRIEETEPPPGLQARIEERLWQAILQEESQRARNLRPRGRRSWLPGLLRPAVAAGAAVTLAIGVAFMSDGGTGERSVGQGQVRQAGSGVLDATAQTLFGRQPSARTAVTGAIDIREVDADDRLLAGPKHDDAGELTGDAEQFANEAPREPAALLDLLRRSADDAGGNQSPDVVAFHVAMQWVVDPAVPDDLRAAMLRSLEGIDGVDEAVIGRDIFAHQGIVIGQLDEATGVRSQYVLDPEDGSALEERAFTTAYLDPACPPGTVTHHVAYDEDGRRVDPSDAQLLDWPLVVQACDPRSR